MGELRLDSIGRSVPWLGLVAGPALAIAVYLILPAERVVADATVGLDHGARSAAGVAALMACWWLTEAIPIGATALVPIALMPLLGWLLFWRAHRRTARADIPRSSDGATASMGPAMKRSFSSPHT